MAAIAESIELQADDLAAPTKSKATYDREQWEIWEEKEAWWCGELSKWVSLAGCYLEGVHERIFDTPTDRYLEKGVAKVDQFPDPEAFFAYKRFNILLKNFHEVRAEAEKVVREHAFDGATTSRPIFPTEWTGAAK